MKFTVDIDILAARDRVVEIFMDRENYRQWNPDIVSLKVITGEPDRDGATVQVKRRIGKQTISVIETLEKNSLPNEITFTYSAPQLWNRARSSFIQSGPNKTTWIIENEFKCNGFYSVLSIVAPGRFKKQSLKEMENFKRFCEDKIYSEIVF